MSKVKLLLDVVQDLRSLADSVQAVADAMMRSDAPDDTGQDAAVQAPAHVEPKEKPIPLETVRAFLGQKSREGYTAEVRGLLQKYGADKLSGVDPRYYPALMKDAEELSGTPKGPADLLGRGGAAK